MSTKILGIHDGHNASIALIVDGEIRFAIEEERLTRVKNSWGTPEHAIREMQARTGIELSELDHIALDGLYMNLHAEPRQALLQLYPGPRGLVQRVRQRGRSIARRVGPLASAYRRHHAGKRIERLRAIGLPTARAVPVEHHTGHAAAAYYSFGRHDNEVLVLTSDARGDGLCGSVSIGRNGRLERIAGIPETESLGRLYSAVTHLLGMKPLEHEYKVMGLAPYGGGDTPQSHRIYRSLRDMFEIPRSSPLVWHRKRGVQSMLGADTGIERLIRYERFDHVAAGLQRFLEDLVTAWVRSCIEATGIRRLVLGGGVFMNVKVNKLVLELPEVDELFVMPSCGDETNSLGAAFWIHANQGGDGTAGLPPLTGLYWGGDFSDREALAAVERAAGATALEYRVDDDINASVADLLARGEVVARHTGRMEFGARALGNRSILANPADNSVVPVINDMIKQRDFWMPFAPSVAAESAESFYRKSKPMPAPYMVMTFDAIPEALPHYRAATHPKDHSTRPQEVYEEWNPCYYRLLKEVGKRTGRPIVLNTSFNLHGYPIVYSPEDALDVLARSGLRHLALGNVLVSKKGSP